MPSSSLTNFTNFNNNSNSNNQPDNSSNNSSSSNNNIPSSSNSYLFSDSNAEQDANFKKVFEEIKENIKIKRLTLIPFDLSPQQRAFLKAWQDAKVLGKHIEIDKLDFPPDKKEELRQLLQDSQSSPERNLGHNYCESSPLLKILITGFIITLIIVPVVLIIRARRRKLKQKP